MFMAVDFGSLFGENGAFRIILGEFINALTEIGSFFVTSPIGIIILAIALISVVWAFFSSIFSNIHKR